MADDLLTRLRERCLALPEAFEVEAWGHPTFRVGSGRGKMFCIAQEDGSSVRIKADPAELPALLAQGAPYYVPSYVGHKGWVGIDLVAPEARWEEAAELIAISYVLVAPKRLAAQMARGPGGG